MSLVKGTIEGEVKQALLKLSMGSHKAEDSTLVNINGALRVHSKAEWDTGKFKLYPVTTMVVTSVKPLDTPWVYLGKCDELQIYIRGSNTQLKPESRPQYLKNTEMMSNIGWFLTLKAQTLASPIASMAPAVSRLSSGKLKFRSRFHSSKTLMF